MPRTRYCVPRDGPFLLDVISDISVGGLRIRMLVGGSVTQFLR